jgi:hypothetical protein
VIIGIFVLSWLTSVIVYKVRRLDRLDQPRSLVSLE